MATYLERFRAMVDDLRERSFVEVVSFEVNPPASSRDLAAVEEALGAPLAATIRRFYEEANGFSVRWRINPELSEDERDRLAERSDDIDLDVPDDDQLPFAFINLIPIEEAIVRRPWPEIDVDAGVEETEFAGETYQHAEFRRRLKPFDVFSDYEAMAFLIEKGKGNPTVLLLTDYYIDWTSSRLTDFPSYLEMLLVTRGIVASRQDFYGEIRRGPQTRVADAQAILAVTPCAETLS